MIYYLIGMMGSGKTTIGRELASQLSYTFIDTDQLIEVYKQMPIHAIIEEEGLEGFRAIEESVLLNMNVRNNTIVACGGGVILSSKNIERMKEVGKIIYLRVSIKELSDRLKRTKQSDRPLLSDDINLSLTNINENRQHIYKDTADLIIDCDHLSINEVVYKILSEIKS